MTGFSDYLNKTRRTKQLIAIAALAAAIITIGFIIMPASTTSAKTFCGYDEHQHDDSCYSEEQELICEMDEHIHSLECYSDPEADIETDSDWEASIKDAGQNVIEIAKTQLGYTESLDNYEVMEDGETKKGITRYGQWYGDSYGDWSAMFCSFCIRYAGIDKKDYPIDASCGDWVEKLKEKGVYHKKGGSYEPQSGDLVFYDFDGDKIAEHVGLVDSVSDEEDGQLITTIEGDHNDQVEYVERNADEDYVLGFGELPRKAEATSAKKVFEGKDFKVTASYSEKAGLPEGVELEVKEIARESDEYESYFEKALKEYNRGLGKDKEVVINFARFFDISFMADGKEVEPEADVDIKITYDDAIKMDDEEFASTCHFSGKDVEILDTKTASKGDDDEIDTFKFSSDSFSVFGNTTAVTYENKNGTYYKKVTSIDSNTANYLIVSVEGSYALNINTGTSPAGTAVRLNPVKGNEEYYTVTDKNGDAPASTIKWVFNSDSTVQSGSSYIRLDSSNIVTTSSSNITKTYDSSTKTWSIKNGSNLLANSTGNFSRTTSSGTTTRMLILKEETVELKIPVDVSGSEEGSGTGGTATKPTYDAHIDPSDAISGSGTYSGSSNVNISWASDPATSNLEDMYSGKNDDGKVLADKSVTYMKDDYSAFSKYDSYTFGITLSALAQEYQLAETSQVATPIDVVFVLDVSNSMYGNNTTEGITRKAAVVNAVNSAMATIMSKNTANRAGIAIYSSGGSELLPLDHYTTGTDKQYLDYVKPSGESNDYIYTNSNLKNSKGVAVTRTNGNASSLGKGTYTQYGLALGAKILQENSDTTYTTTIGEGTEFERKVTVKRQPVIILLSDGDPTHSTPNYTDVTNGPHYGSGIYTNSNNKGIHGFYTILSANYYKRMVGINYDQKALMYSIGMGINETGTDDMSTQSRTGDHYKRAVLNPNAANVAALSGGKNSAENVEMLKALLSSTYSAQYVQTGTSSSYAMLGTTNQYEPVIANPYAADYSYADGAYFGNLTTSDLESIFNKIIEDSNHTKTYGLLLQKRSSCEMEDTIGDGMELKGEPKLSYGGKVYTASSSSTEDTGEADFNKVTTYVYKYTYKTTDGSNKTVELENISVKVFKNTTKGTQKVVVKIPDEAMPVFTPGGDGKLDWYYEALPVRLIYQVGLTEDSVDDIKALKSGETLTFNTNAWKDGVTASSTVYPTDDNPYYDETDGGYANYSTDKASNASATAAKAITSARTRVTTVIGDSSVNTQEVDEVLGNNGTMTFTADAAELTVTKVWDGVAEADIPSKVQIQLYRKSANETETAVGDPVDITPDSDKNWKYKFTSLPKADSKGAMYDYRVEEVSYGPYTASYSTNAASYDSTAKTITPITITNTAASYALPGTGGEGALPLTCAGITLMMLVAALGYRRFRVGR